MKQRIGAFFDKYPVAETLVELLFTAFFTFAPILAAAFLAIARNPEFDRIGFGKAFWSFFAKGELSLVALGICGSILFIIILKPNSAHAITNAFFVLVVAIVIFLIGAIVGDNPGFQQVRPDWLLNVILISYFVLNVIWLIMSIKSKKIEVVDSATSVVSRADQIIATSRKRGGR